MAFKKWNIRNQIEKRKQESPEFKEAYDSLRELTLFARKLAELRRERGMSQADIAVKMGTSQQTISRLESPGYHGYTIKTLLRYAAALDAQLKLDLIIHSTRSGAA